MIRKVLIAFAGLLVVTGASAAHAEMVTTEEALGEMSIGRKDAPISILAFESLTCPHCASFHVNTYPKLKKEYVDTGKVRIVFVDYPLNARAMVGSMLARCTGPERYVAMTDLMFRTQAEWAGIQKGSEFLDAMRRIGGMGGLTGEDVDKCLKDRTLYEGIRKRQMAAQEKHNLSSTPTFIIGDKRIVGDQPFEQFEAVLNPMIEGKK